jgi:hypothetical protein
MWSTVVDDAAALKKRAQGARDRAEKLVGVSTALVPVHRRTLSACLVTRTAVIDRGCSVTADRNRDLTKLSNLVGRDIAIEQAKGDIAERYGITRGEAFELLRHMSQTGNRKLRDVAHAVLQDGTKRPA